MSINGNWLKDSIGYIVFPPSTFPSTHSQSMAASTKQIAVLYVSRPPPLTLPLLIAQTDLCLRLPTVLAQAQLPRPEASSNSKEGPTRGVIRHSRPVKRATPGRLHPLRNASPDLEGLSDLSSLSDMDPDENMISKPPGEPGRPGRGGYNLELAVNWPPARFSRLKVWCSPADLQQFLNTCSCLYIKWSMNTLIPRKLFRTKNQVWLRQFATL